MGFSNYSSCARTDQPGSGCDSSTLRNCECIVLDSNTNGSAVAIASLRDSTYTQACIQLALSSVSVLLLILHLSTYVLAPRRMWRYPLTVAVWIYVLDLAVAVQFVVVSAAAVRYSHAYDGTAPWPITSDAPCLCDVSPLHPGCRCQGGMLAFMLQFGLVGSTAFYCCLAHNLYRSVSDPFTRPSSRFWLYHRYSWGFALALSFAYLVPQSSYEDVWSGYGYQYHYQMCWSPLRFGDKLINNPQVPRTSMRLTRRRPLARLLALHHAMCARMCARSSFSLRRCQSPWHGFPHPPCMSILVDCCTAADWAADWAAAAAAVVATMAGMASRAPFSPLASVSWSRLVSFCSSTR